MSVDLKKSRRQLQLGYNVLKYLTTNPTLFNQLSENQRTKALDDLKTLKEHLKIID